MPWYRERAYWEILSEPPAPAAAEQPDGQAGLADLASFGFQVRSN